MAIWQGGYKIVGGLLSGLKCPAGTLTGLAANINNYFGSYTSYGSDDESATAWDGAFGTDGDDIINYAVAHADGQQHDFPLMELEFVTPAQATFEKQTLMIYGGISCTKSEGGTPPDNYEGYNIAFYLSNMTRRWFVNGAWNEEQLPGIHSAFIGAGNWIVTVGDLIDDWTYQYIIDRLYAAVSPYTYNNTNYFGAAYYIKDLRGDYGSTEAGNKHRYVVSGALMSISEETIQEYFGSDEPIKDDDPYDPPGPKPPKPGPGGDGPHRRINDPIPIPDLPPIGPADAGFVTMYKMSVSEMQTFAADLYDPSAWQAIKAFFADPMDFIVGCMLVPFFPEIGNAYYPKFGNFTWGHSYSMITNEFYELSCGTLHVDHFYNSCFDYAPYYKIKIFLPYIGYRDLPTDDVMGNDLTVKYHCDCLTGDLVAFVMVTNNGVPKVISQFSGNCGVRVPTNAVSYNAAVQAGIQLIGGAVGMGAGALAGAAGLSQNNDITSSQIASQVSSATVGAVNALKANTERSGNIGATAGFMGIQKPHLLIELPEQDLPDFYRELEGYPSNEGGVLGMFTGFTAVESIKLSGFAATKEEKDMILQMLKAGVII